MNLLFKKFIKKIQIDKVIIVKGIETLLVPIILLILGFIVVFLAEGIYSSEDLYNATKDSLIEPIIRALVIIFILFLINKKRIKFLFNKKDSVK